MPAEFDDLAALQNVDAVGMHHGRETMRDQNRDAIARARDFANRLADFFFSERIERRSRFVENHQLRPPQQGTRDGEPLLLAARNFDAAFADHGVESFIGAGEKAADRGLAKDVHAVFIGGARIDEEQVLADGTGEQLRILRDEADAFAQIVDGDFVFAGTVVKDVAGMRPVKTDEELNQSGLAGTGGPDKSDRLPARNLERNRLQRRPVGSLVLESNVVESEGLQRADADGVFGSRLGLQGEDGLEVFQRRFGFAISVNDVAEFLQRSKDEERIDEERKELADRDALREDQIEHQEQDRGAQKVDKRSLDEAQTAEILHLFEFELQDFSGGRVEVIDLLLCEPEAFYQFDVAQRFGGRSGERGGLLDDRAAGRL